ncbi:hypothetical protein C0J52_09050 [Blattella germanica]|nr:hypothetical protein C0J52_09050 [Blattella germanica]
MFRVFTISNWFLIFLTLLITSIIFNVIEVLYQFLDVYKGKLQIYTENTNLAYTTSRCILDMWSVLLGIGVFSEPTKLSLRILFLTWIVFSLSINTIYQSFVVSYFFDPGLQHQVDSYDDIVDRNYTMLFDSELRALPYMFTNPGSVYISSESNQIERKLLEPINFVVNSPNSAILFSEELFNYYTQKLCKSSLFNKVHKFSSKSHHVHVFVNVINPLLRIRFRTLMQRLIQGGFPEKIMRDVTDPCGRFSFMTQKIGVDNYVQMSLLHFQSSLILYAVGIILAVVSFFCETLFWVQPNFIHVIWKMFFLECSISLSEWNICKR